MFPADFMRDGQLLIAWGQAGEASVYEPLQNVVRMDGQMKRSEMKMVLSTMDCSFEVGSDRKRVMGNCHGIM